MGFAVLRGLLAQEWNPWAFQLDLLGCYPHERNLMAFSRGSVVCLVILFQLDHQQSLSQFC